MGVLGIAAMAAGVATAAPVLVKGDLDGNGRVTKADVQIAMIIFLRPQTATDAQRRAADVDGDGRVTLKDLRIMLQRASSVR
ncbi:MAG: dockerin type I repeat-containing protein [Armatimonadota bacterium]